MLVYQGRIRLAGEIIGPATIETKPATEDDYTDGPVYFVETEGGEEWASDEAEARDVLAGLIREQRNNRAEEVEDERRDEVRDLLEALIDGGRTLAALKALRAL
jgi:hypothetical protein